MKILGGGGGGGGGYSPPSPPPPPPPPKIGGGGGGGGGGAKNLHPPLTKWPLRQSSRTCGRFFISEGISLDLPGTCFVS